MNVLLSQKHCLVGGRHIEEFYAGEFHDAACIRKTALVRCGGCNGEREEGSKEVRQALTVLMGDGTWAGEGGSRVNLLPAQYNIRELISLPVNSQLVNTILQGCHLWWCGL